MRLIPYLTILWLCFATHQTCAQCTNLIFDENFENGLTRWTGRYGGSNSGVVTNDPLGGSSKVLSFTGFSYNGDLFTRARFNVSGASRVLLQFDYLGKAVAGSIADNFGGFVGVCTTLDCTNGAWVAGTLLSAVTATTNFTKVHLVDDGLWHTYTVDITPFLPNNQWTALHVMLEDWGSSGRVGDVFFDNIRIYAAQPTINLQRLVKPDFSGLTAGLTYQLQVSPDLVTWTNVGLQILATNCTMVSTQQFAVDNWNSLHFRLQQQ